MMKPWSVIISYKISATHGLIFWVLVTVILYLYLSVHIDVVRKLDLDILLYWPLLFLVHLVGCFFAAKSLLLYRTKVLLLLLVSSICLFAGMRNRMTSSAFILDLPLLAALVSSQIRRFSQGEGILTANNPTNVELTGPRVNIIKVISALLMLQLLCFPLMLDDVNLFTIVAIIAFVGTILTMRSIRQLRWNWLSKVWVGVVLGQSVYMIWVWGEDFVYTKGNDILAWIGVFGSIAMGVMVFDLASRLKSENAASRISHI